MKGLLLLCYVYVDKLLSLYLNFFTFKMSITIDIILEVLQDIIITMLIKYLAQYLAYNNVMNKY